MLININGIDLYYEKQGEGSPLLLLHGNGEDHSIFETLILRLKNHFTVYAIDSRNHGRSSKTTDYSYQTMTEDIYQFISALQLHNPSIVGFSDGAIIATILEINYPNTFNKIGLLGINLTPSDFKEENFAYLAEEYERTKDPLLKLMLEEPNIELESLSLIKAPTLVVRAEDELFRDELYDEIVGSMANAQLLIMEGYNHDSYVVNSDALYDKLLLFL